MSDLHSVVEALQKINKSKHIAVIGDCMLDEYNYGIVSRINPEAPAPIFNIKRTKYGPGGAAHVAACISKLGVEATCIGIIGNDSDSHFLSDVLSICNVNKYLIAGNMPTIRKSRYVAENNGKLQQVMRCDRDVMMDYSYSQEHLDGIKDILTRSDSVVIADHGKCAINAQVLDLVRQAGIPIYIDPHKDADVNIYKRCDAITPNASEAQYLSINTSVDRMAEHLHDIADNVFITMDSEGIYLMNHTTAKIIPTSPKTPLDVTGAGDSVISMIATMLTYGNEPELAAKAANIAGGLQVEKIGASPITMDEIIIEAHRQSGQIDCSTIINSITANAIRSNKSIVLTNGCFDILHAGHIHLLNESKKLGDILIVAVNSDRSVRSIKGKNRPINNEDDRIRMVSAINSVDHVMTFDQDTPEDLINLIKPDFLTKGADTDIILGSDTVLNSGGLVIKIPEFGNVHSSEIIERCRNS